MDAGPEINSAGQPVAQSGDLGGKSEAAPPSVQLTTLQPVAICDVWPTEPHHFTPWLLANSERLSKVLGLAVELENREFQVGQFSLDLIGKELSTGSTVIIENQYGPTDHGQRPSSCGSRLDGTAGRVA